MITEQEYLNAKKIVQEYESMNLNTGVVDEIKNRYTKMLDKILDDDIYTVEKWEELVDEGCIIDDDGIGYWVKDGFRSNDEVFWTPQLDATHVVWYNK